MTPTEVEAKLADWETAAATICAAVAEHAGSVAKRASEDIYERLMLDVQDYLRENVAFNLASELATARRESKAAQDEVQSLKAERDQAVGALMAPQFRVWWIPQVPMRAFQFAVPDVATGRLLCDALGQYDEFQLKNRIKPDYCNAGGISFNHPVVTAGEWWDWPDDEEEAADLAAEIDGAARAELAGVGS